MTSLQDTHIYNSPEKTSERSGFKLGRFIPKRSFFKVFLTVVLLAGLVSVTYLIKRNQDLRSGAQPGNVVNVFISPYEVTAGVGYTFSFNVFANNPNLSVSAATVQLNYDTRYLELVNLGTTDYLPTELALFKGNGKAIISVGNLENTPQTESGNLATAVFRVVGDISQTTISLEGTQVAVTESDIDAAHIFGDLKVLSVNISPTPTLYPTPTPPLSPTPYPTLTPPPPSASAFPTLPPPTLKPQ